MIELQAGETYLLYGKPHVGKTTLALQLMTQFAKDKNIVYVPTEIYKHTLDRWTPVFRQSGWGGNLVIQAPINKGWTPEEKLTDLFEMFGDVITVGSVPGKNKLGEDIYLRSFRVLPDDALKEKKIGKPHSVIRALALGGEQLFIIDSISAPVKAVFELAADLGGNLSPRDTCLSRLLFYIKNLCVDYNATVVLVDHESRDPRNPYSKPKPYGPSAFKYLAKYWMLLTQSEAKEYTDIHELTLTRNIGDREYEERYMLRLTDNGFKDMTSEEIAELTKRKKKEDDK